MFLSYYAPADNGGQMGALDRNWKQIMAAAETQSLSQIADGFGVSAGDVAAFLRNRSLEVTTVSDDEELPPEPGEPIPVKAAVLPVSRPSRKAKSFGKGAWQVVFSDRDEKVVVAESLVEAARKVTQLGHEKTTRTAVLEMNWLGELL